MTDGIKRDFATEARLLKRSCESLLGLATGMMADGRLDDAEIRFLNQWLADNEALVNCWPREVVYAKVKDVLADGVITDEERVYLEETLSSLIGGTLQETGAAFGASTSLPLDSVDGIEIPGRAFCFTGKFLYGTRAACERAVVVRDGICRPNVRKDLDYLVIGTLASHAWANTSHGRKIEKAMAYKRDGSPILVVSEKLWVREL